jgi:hypothetical protein
MGNGNLADANLLVRRLLDEISKLEAAMPEACKAMGVSPEDIARLANGQRVSGKPWKLSGNGSTNGWFSVGRSKKTTIGCGRPRNRHAP